MESNDIGKYFSKLKKFELAQIEKDIDLNSKSFIRAFLNYICDNQDLSISKQKEILNCLRNKIIITCLNHDEIVDEFVISAIVTYQRMKTDTLFEEYFLNFTKFLYFIQIMTRNVNLTNQIMSNIINIINKVLNCFLLKSEEYKLEAEYCIQFLYLLELNILIVKGINSYNPRIQTYLDRVLHFMFSIKPSELKINNDIFDQLYPKYSTKNNLYEFFHSKTSELLNLYSDFLQNDINYDIVFRTIYENVHNFILEKQNKKIGKFYENFLKQYENQKEKSQNKKIFPMNFLIIKPKPLASLEPEYDLSFLGNSAEFVNYEEKKKNMDRIMKHKIRSTEKQAIRKLKKEAKVIDIERQKVIENIDRKRKEDIKITNQFIEQQNIDYKKMMTSNEKRRFKFKKKK